MKPHKPVKRNGPARALAKPEARQRVIPDKRAKERNRQLAFYVLAAKKAGMKVED